MPHPTDGESSSDDSADDSNRYDDAEEDVEIDFNAQMQAQARAQAAAIASQYGEGDDDDEEDDEEEDEEEEEVEVPVEADAPVEAVAAVAQPQYAGIRGKPEAMASALAAATIDDVKHELDIEKQQQMEEDTGGGATNAAEASVMEATAVVAEPVAADATGVSKAEVVDAHATPDPEYSAAVAAKPPAKKKKKPAKKSPSSAGASRKSPKTTPGSSTIDLNAPSLDDPMAPITNVEYENLVHLMEHFCKVPLLAEFSRPVTLLHPELMAAYSKIVSHPIDLGKVCRKIGRRQYKNTREVQLDMWRIFSNCVKYHSHPSNKEGVPSFVSIALHLREYWNNLFQEFMLPSDAPPESAKNSKASNAAKHVRETFATRETDRQKRLIVSGLTCMSPNCLKRCSVRLSEFIANQGRVDKLDKDPIFPGSDPLGADIDQDDRKDLAVVVEKLTAVSTNLQTLSEEQAEYTVEQFDIDLKACYTTDVFENNKAMQFRVRNRMNRLFGKILVPINEANSRGVTQSSIWGCMAAAIWARESSKKPYWPALVLGILAPADQKEEWHGALTERNEARLPEALRAQLGAGKRKSEQALRKQALGQLDPQSYFLVEFLGTHEFIWVRETDIVETFEPEEDPNQKTPTGKKKKIGGRNSSLVGSKKYQAAIEEAGWALEEFEMQLQDACGDPGEDEDGEDGNYSYSVLCVSDDEADDAYADTEDMTMSEIEEANELIATRGLIDFSVTGRKNAKKRALALKKQKQEAEKKEKLEKAKKAKVEQAKKKRKDNAAQKNKEREEKKELREIERRRKKRSREREKALKSASKKNKRRRPNEEMETDKAKEGGGALMLDKRTRATAIVKGYLTRMSSDKEYRSLGLQGIMSIPAAQVDSSGLLGMALAFRAAAGEISMPEESGDQEQPKPWDAPGIKVDDTMNEKERLKALHKQAELLENEIKRVRSATKTRLHLMEEADRARKKLDDDIYKDEETARSNPYKKRKKPLGSTGKGTDDSPMGASEAGKDDNNEEETGDAASGKPETDDTLIDLGPSHISDTPPREVPTATMETEAQE